MRTDRLYYVEPLSPQLRVGLGIDKLRADPNIFARPADTSFEHIAHAQLAADLLRVDRFVPVAERRITRYGAATATFSIF